MHKDGYYCGEKEKGGGWEGVYGGACADSVLVGLIEKLWVELHDVALTKGTLLMAHGPRVGLARRHPTTSKH